MAIYGTKSNMNYIKVKSNSDTWSDVKTTYVKTNNGWIPVKLMYTKVGSTRIPMIPGNLPTIFKVTPAAILVIGAPTTTTILGSNFTQNMTVRISYYAYGYPLIIVKNITGSALTVVDKNKLTFNTPTGFVGSGTISVIDSNSITGNSLPYSFLPNYNLIVNRTTISVNSGFYNGILTVSERGGKVRQIRLNLNGAGSFTVTPSRGYVGLWPVTVRFPDGTTPPILRIKVGR